MSTVFVTNNWDKDLEDSYAYKAYKFPVGETVEVPEEVACYVFAYNVEDKVPTLARQGWAKTRVDIPEGLKILEKFSVSATKPTKNHSLSPVVDKVPLPSAKRDGGKVLAKAA